MRPPPRPLAFVLFALLAAVAVDCGDSDPGPTPETPFLTPTSPDARTAVRIGDLEIEAEVVSTPAARSLGLGGRDSLAEGAGMLFVFPAEGRHTFCMCGMRFPLDFVWISANRRVVDLTKGLPPPTPGAPASEVADHQPGQNVLYVLEVNAGVIDGAGLEVGDEVKFDPPVSTTNLFANPGFEEGEEPWFSLRTEGWGTAFSLSSDDPRSGATSALLELRSEDDLDPARVYGVVQEVSPDEFPEVLSGYYRVGRWEQGTPKQYLQFVVIVSEADNIPPEVAAATNHQIRYILAGVDAPPIEIGNARFVMVGTGRPQVDQWVRFERNVRQDFEQLWGAVPAGFSKLRLLFEVRWDDRDPSAGPSTADVFYDDLYLGATGAQP